MEDLVDRYGTRFTNLVDSNGSRKEYEFDQVLLMPTARGYRDLVKQADIEMGPKVKNYLLKRWSKGTLENLSYFVMAAAVYARSVSDPPCEVDVGEVLLRTVASCNLRCAQRKETGGGCRAAMMEGQHHLLKCIKVPRNIDVIWRCVKRYIATGEPVSIDDALKAHTSMSIKIDLHSDFAPTASC